MLVRCDFNLSAWIKNVEIEAEDEEDAIEKLGQMTLDELLDAGGYEKDSDITDVDTKIARAVYSVHVNSVDYDITEDDLDFEVGDVESEIDRIKSELPQEFDIDVEVYLDDYDNELEALDDQVVDAITDKTGFLIDSADYEIKKIS